MSTLDSRKNFAITSATTGYSAGATSVVITTGDGAKFPQPSTDGEFNLVWWDSTTYANPADDPNVEIVRCTARTSDTLTITRAQEGTSATAKNTAGHTYKLQLGPTAKMITDIETALDAKELLANKDTDGTLAANSDTKYASQKAVKTYIDTGLGTKQNSLGYTAENTANKGAANGYTPLGSDSKIASTYLPAIAITDTFVVASQAEMLALTAETGDVAVRTDENKTYILQGTDPSILANWVWMKTPTDLVLSVNGQTGAVSLTTTDIAEGTNLYFTTGRAQSAMSGLYEVPLTISTGLTRATNTITNNLSTGVSGGQTVIGGTASGNSLTLSSTSHATKGSIILGTSSYNEVVNTLGIGTTASTLHKLVMADTVLAGSGSLDGSLINMTQTWSTTGSPTSILLNVTNTASGANAKLIDLKVGGVSQFNVSKAGVVTTTGIIESASQVRGSSFRITLGGSYIWNGGSQIKSATDGLIQLLDSAGTDFIRLQLGGTTSSFPAIKKNGAAINFRLADDSADASITAGSATLSGASTIADTVGAGSGSLAGSVLSMTQTWNTSGNPTAIKLNVTNTASGASALLMDLQVGGVSQFKVDKAGIGTFAGALALGGALTTAFNVSGNSWLGSTLVRCGATSGFSWNGRSFMGSPADGQITLSNGAITDFSRLNFGGTTSSFPAIKRNGTAINFRLADDSADCGITASTAIFSGAVTLSDTNLVLGTTTGTKFGTATSQKLSFWNASPIVQPTTAIAAATFVANTSLIANDTATFDGYTVGQVVKALRNVGLLA